MSMNGLLNYGDEVLVPMPDYPLWTASVTLAGGKAFITDVMTSKTGILTLKTWKVKSLRRQRQLLL